MDSELNNEIREWFTNVEVEAIGLAMAYKMFCQSNNVDPSSIIAGVSFDAHRLWRDAYQKGRDDVKKEVLVCLEGKKEVIN